MELKELFGVVAAGILANNYALQNNLGTTNLLGFAGKKGGQLCVGLGVTVVTVIAAAVCAALGGLLPGYLHTLVFTAVVLAVCGVCQLAASRICKKSGFCLPLVALNSAVLGVCLNNAASGLTVLESVLTALGVGLGFLVGLLVFAGICERLDDRQVPAALRGLPIRLVAAGILSLALFCF